MLNPQNIGRGQEQYECYKDYRKKQRCQYDYRDEQGELFSCVRSTLAECRAARDEWKARREVKSVETNQEHYFGNAEKTADWFANHPSCWVCPARGEICDKYMDSDCEVALREWLNKAVDKEV